jgi:hypothetical protein
MEDPVTLCTLRHTNQNTLVSSSRGNRPCSPVLALVVVTSPVVSALLFLSHWLAYSIDQVRHGSTLLRLQRPPRGRPCWLFSTGLLCWSCTPACNVPLSHPPGIVCLCSRPLSCLFQDACLFAEVWEFVLAPFSKHRGSEVATNLNTNVSQILENQKIL